MTPEQYRTALDAVTQLAAGGNDLWNQRFIAGLEVQGLMLLPCVDKQPPPKAHYLQAPWPFSEGLPIWPDAWVVEQESPSELSQLEADNLMLKAANIKLREKLEKLEKLHDQQ